MLPITSSWPVTGKAATGMPDANASRTTLPKVSVKLGNRNLRQWHRPATKPRRAAYFEITSMGKRRSRPGPRRHVARNNFGARNASRFILRRHAAHRRKHGPLEAEFRLGPGPELVWVHPARSKPKPPVSEAMALQIGQKRGRSDHAAKRPAVEASHPPHSSRPAALAPGRRDIPGLFMW